uniref:Uncharacterized protein n=1 Tax=Rhizophora mucronata TaxID=61149 RepID=A0A2P2QX00_RHIMU
MHMRWQLITHSVLHWITSQNLVYFHLGLIKVIPTSFFYLFFIPNMLVLKMVGTMDKMNLANSSKFLQ